MLRRMLSLLLVGCAARAPDPKPAAPEARRAPDFTLADTDGRDVTLSRLLESGPVILAFFPKAFTGG
jgi:cytochrome oxidase Cu insertion factor (SCO1/SenC/PrrC family)